MSRGSRRTTIARLWRSVRRRPADDAGLGLIEVLVAMVMMSVGLMAVAGISLQVAAQNTMSTWETDRALAAQLVMERLQRAPYASVTSGTDTVGVGNRTYVVTRSVTTPLPRVKNVQLAVSSALGRGSTRTFVGRIHDNRQLPAAP